MARMAMITKFDSDPGRAEGDERPISYDTALFALRYDSGVAENVFARLAKKDFRSFLKKPVLMHTMQDGEVTPIWVEHKTVVLDAKDFPPQEPKPEEDSSQSAKLLSTMVYELANSVNRACKNSDSIILIEPLSVRVLSASHGRFSFSVKQRWSAQHG